MEAMRPVKIYSAADKVEAGILMNLLEGNGISSFKQGTGSGGFMEIEYGFSIYGQDIYVDEQDAERAMELIQEVMRNVEVPDEIEEEAEEEEKAEIQYRKRHGRKQIIFIRILVVLAGLDLFFTLLFNLIN